jgi:dGTPase
MIGVMVDDVLAVSQERLKELNPQSVDDVRNHDKAIVQFSSTMFAELKLLRAFLMENMYRHYTIQRIWVKAEKIISDLFNVFMGDNRLLPNGIQDQVKALTNDTNGHIKARIIADHIACMTDRTAAAEHEKIFNLYKDL